MNNQQKYNYALEILDFWSKIEFLNQKKFPAISKNNPENPKKQEDCLNVIHKFPLEKEISVLIEEDTLRYVDHPKCSTNIHLCIGKIRREMFIQSLYRFLEQEDNRPEEDTNELCLIGLKTSQDGTYIPGSLQISPIAWAVTQYLEGTNNPLVLEKYTADMKSLEEDLDENVPVSYSKILKLYSAVWNRFVKPICKLDSPNLTGAMFYTRYDSDETFEREDEKAEDYSGLINTFYQNDFNMIQKSFREGLIGTATSRLPDYIISIFCKQNSQLDSIGTGYIDILKDKEAIESWLHAEKTPSGKWPSFYNPALMQQIAINIATSKSEESQSVFSVNGPPGTGKTTLLKEIIASNIVERAKLLTKYGKADDAFCENSFQNGDCRNNGYDKYFYKYHSFVDSDLADFSMLVASCNNAAVENITYELPNAETLVKGLSVPKDADIETANGLQEIANLFDVTKTYKKEKYNVRKKGVDGIYNSDSDIQDVYFSWYAQGLIQPIFIVDEDPMLTQWGLISAPMGKSSNISKYCHRVLKPLCANFLDNEQIKNRHDVFLNAKEKFSKQLKVVEDIRKSLSQISHVADAYKNIINQHQQKIVQVKNYIECLKEIGISHQNNVEALTNQYLQVAQLIAEAEIIREQCIDIYQKDEEIYHKELQKMEQYRAEIIRYEDSRKLHEILFHKRAHTERLRRIASLKIGLEQAQKTAYNAEKKLNESQNNYSSKTELLNSYQRQLAEITNQIETEKKASQLSAQQVENQYRLINELQETIRNEEDELSAVLKQCGSSMTVIDEEFWTDLFGSDMKASTKAHVSDPWITNHYNREREKLFYLALQLHKEFVLSSKCCRENFINLLMLWKQKENSGKEICKYSDLDRQNAYPHLLNTLFLLTPVMSTTFASVGRFLGDIKQPEQLGLLIIDEAGQASPHVALGALWRCKKAIIVGDPKQVEPVVTDNADIFKQLFVNEITWPYTEKTISVQECADIMNPYGTQMKDSESISGKSWVGCPLVVHRRCVEPMFSISNYISYDNIMKIQTAKPKPEIEEKFLKNSSMWINIGGNEIGRKNHYVREQGQEALKLIIQSFEKYEGFPDLYVISPFTSVIKSMQALVKESMELQQYKGVAKWAKECCGTVHTFQGKEAAEVIFLLGCDKTAIGAVRWVKPNILNVAATRAKYRLYIIGDYSVWKKSDIFVDAKRIIDEKGAGF